MKIGTKSLLFGVHQFIWHPITVYMAWCKLYGIPNIKEALCIALHDWGYWNKPNMDGEEGTAHPELAASIAYRLLGEEYYNLCLYHSRAYAERHETEPSKLCWADKLSIAYEPTWFYLLRAKLSGELKEYREKSAVENLIQQTATNKDWFYALQGQFIGLVKAIKNIEEVIT